jgi:hypothetical protein
MENIFTLIVIIIAVLSVFSKLKGKQKTQPGGAWVTKLRTFLTDIQRKIEQQSKDHTAGASGWDQLLDSSETFKSPSDADEAAPDDQVLVEAETQPPAKRMPPEAPVRIQKTLPSDTTQLVPAAQRRKALHAGKRSHTFRAAGRADLRKAVIWSEILGPPIALRDRRSGRR